MATPSSPLPGTLPSWLNLSPVSTESQAGSDYISAMEASSTIDPSEQAAPNSIYNYLSGGFSELSIIGWVVVIGLGYWAYTTFGKHHRGRREE